MTVRGFVSWYLGSVIFVATAGATGYQILSRQHATETAEIQPSSPAPSQPAAVATSEPAPAAQRVPTTTPAPAPSGLSAQDALALLPFSPPAQHGLPPLRRHTTLPDRHVVRHKPEIAVAAARHLMPPSATALPPRVTYYYAYPAYYPYAASYPYGGYYVPYPYYYRAF
jgi:hypothetical protein